MQLQKMTDKYSVDAYRDGLSGAIEEAAEDIGY